MLLCFYSLLSFICLPIQEHLALVDYYHVSWASKSTVPYSCIRLGIFFIPAAGQRYHSLLCPVCQYLYVSSMFESLIILCELKTCPCRIKEPNDGIRLWNPWNLPKCSGSLYMVVVREFLLSNFFVWIVQFCFKKWGHNDINEVLCKIFNLEETTELPSNYLGHLPPFMCMVVKSQINSHITDGPFCCICHQLKVPIRTA